MSSQKGRRYYQIARIGARDLKTPVMRELLIASKGKKKILDLGCGDGSRLAIIAQGKKGVGLDSSSLAIREGEKRYPRLKLIKGKAEELPFKDAEFDFIYSAFVLEHLREPERMIEEARRVLKKGGTLFLAAPNFGAPNRRSPCSRENKYLKLVKGFLNDFLILAKEPKTLSWQKVKPRLSEPYQIDFDTQVEPYILTLIRFLKSQELKITRYSTFWEIKEENQSFPFRLIKTLGQFGVYPFVFWGPQFLVIAEKNR